MFTCEECGKEFKSQKTHANHMQKLHPSDVDQLEVNNDPIKLPNQVPIVPVSKITKNFTELLSFGVSLLIIQIVKRSVVISEADEDALDISGERAKIMLQPIVDLMNKFQPTANIVKVVGENSSLATCAVAWVDYIITLNKIIKRNAPQLLQDKNQAQSIYQQNVKQSQNIEENDQTNRVVPIRPVIPPNGIIPVMQQPPIFSPNVGIL